MSFLLDLPAEVRNTIYSLVLVKSEPIEPQSQHHRAEERIIMGFVRTNKQIYEESIKLYYNSNVFLFRCESPMGFSHCARCRLKAGLARFFEKMPSEMREVVERVDLRGSSAECFDEA
ncbi:hypothetical protein EJ03DRAFT_19381 [Teratosphaeria nubilosa]|uniref:Uncharacterized protein n=1 Tax=Teratosphaeria nubilosa TaxID=161662 RepID=A0A6G1KWR0_9PEZI|nr:hypothetical protein EJ03DRAFT_19381 [Teratosphaeria nubilosa]